MRLELASPATSHCAVLQHHKRSPPTSFCVAHHFFTACLFVWLLEVTKPYTSVKVFRIQNEPSTAQWLLCAPPDLALSNSTFCPHSVFMCFVWI